MSAQTYTTAQTPQGPHSFSLEELRDLARELRDDMKYVPLPGALMAQFQRELREGLRYATFRKNLDFWRALIAKTDPKETFGAENAKELTKFRNFVFHKYERDGISLVLACRGDVKFYTALENLWFFCDAIAETPA